MTAGDKVLLGFSEGSIRQLQTGEFCLIWEGDDVDTYASLDEAISDLAGVCDDYSGPVTYGISREEVWEAAELAGVDEVCPYSPDGWVCFEGVWVPGAFLPDYDGPHDRFPEREAFGDMGCSAAVHQWENVTLIVWSGPEGEGEGFSIEQDMAFDQAVAEAKAMVLELQAEWNLLYEELVGLGNLDEPDRFPVPDDVEELGEVCSYLPEWGEEAASVDVVYWTSGGAAPFLVTSEGLVVGRYSSLEELRDHIDPGEFFEATDELREPDSDD